MVDIIKPKVIIVVAMNKYRVIGVNNQLPWHIPEDLAYFKQITLGKPIIMGRKTFESIGRVLPGRKNIVITQNSNWEHPGVEVTQNLEQAVNLVKDSPEVCVIGGGEIFNQALPIADCLHITIVDVIVDNPSVFFPFVDLKRWQLASSREIISQSGIKCCFNEYIRRIA